MKSGMPLLPPPASPPPASPSSLHSPSLDALTPLSYRRAVEQRRTQIAVRSSTALRRLQPKCVIVMVGLPARGKSYIVRMIRRYMNWLDFPTRVFNAGNYRRTEGKAGAASDFFSASPRKVKERESYAKMALDDLLRWQTEENGHIGILDATNTTRARRAWVVQVVADFSPDIHVLFIESVCDDEEILSTNYRMKLNNADYESWDPVEALADFRRRVSLYEKVYEPIEDQYEGALSYIRLINIGRRVTGNMCHGLLKSELLFYLANVHVKRRRIWLVRSGETVNDTGACSFIYRYIPRESCSQFDSLPLTSLTIPQARYGASTTTRFSRASSAGPRRARVCARARSGPPSPPPSLAPLRSRCLLLSCPRAPAAARAGASTPSASTPSSISGWGSSPRRAQAAPRPASRPGR